MSGRLRSAFTNFSGEHNLWISLGNLRGRDGWSLPSVSAVLFSHLSTNMIYKRLKTLVTSKTNDLFLPNIFFCWHSLDRPYPFFISSSFPALSSSSLAVPSPPTPHRPCTPARATPTRASPVSPTHHQRCHFSLLHSRISRQWSQHYQGQCQRLLVETDDLWAAQTNRHLLTVLFQRINSVFFSQ
jgi:hypothetical protein